MNIIEKQSIEINNLRNLVSDNLTDFNTLNNLIRKPIPDLNNIKNIIGKAQEDNYLKLNNVIDINQIIKENYLYDIKDIKNYQDILNILDEKEFDLGDTWLNSVHKLRNISKVFNQGWIPDWNNPNEFKYYPWFYLDDKGGGFRLNAVDFHCSSSAVSAWLCFRSKELCELSVDLFLDIYEDYYKR